MKGKIKPGSFVSQEGEYFYWPENKAHFIFDIEMVRENLIKCTKSGYGEKKKYGNGCLYVYDLNDIKNEKTFKKGSQQIPGN